MPNLSSFKTREEFNRWYRDYRLANLEKMREYKREYNKAWRKEHGYYIEKRWNKKNQFKRNIESRTQYMIRRGKIKRLPCLICGEEHSLAHHINYSEPFNVLFLCPVHHAMVHENLRKLNSG